MKLTLLGTGTSQGVPVIGCKCEVCLSDDPKDKRLRTSALFHSTQTQIAIDCGPDFRQQMLRAQNEELDAILITHTHNDHIIGLDDVRPFNFSMNKSIPIYGLQEHLNEIRSRFDYIFSTNPYPGAPRLELYPIQPYETFHIEGNAIIPILVRHGQLQVLGFRIQDKAYITDTNSISDQSLKLLSDLEVLVLDALHHQKHHSHYNFEEAMEMAIQIGAKKTYFTHMSHRMGCHAKIEQKCPKNIHLGYDGLTI